MSHVIALMEKEAGLGYRLAGVDVPGKRDPRGEWGGRQSPSPGIRGAARHPGRGALQRAARALQERWRRAGPRCSSPSRPCRSGRGPPARGVRRAPDPEGGRITDKDTRKREWRKGGIIVRVSAPRWSPNAWRGADHNRVLVGRTTPGRGDRLEADRATIQVYEDTTGLGLGEGSPTSGNRFSRSSAPGSWGSCNDGVQRPLHAVRAEERRLSIGRGQSARPSTGRNR